MSGGSGECAAAPLRALPAARGVWWWWTGGLAEALAPSQLAGPLRAPGGFEVREVGPVDAQGAPPTAGNRSATLWRLAAGVSRLAAVGAGPEGAGSEGTAVVVAALRRWGEGGVAEFDPASAGWVPAECLSAAGQGDGAFGGWTAQVALGCSDVPALSVRSVVVSAGVCVLRMRGETPVAC